MVYRHQDRKGTAEEYGGGKGLLPWQPTNTEDQEQKCTLPGPTPSDHFQTVESATKASMDPSREQHGSPEPQSSSKAPHWSAGDLQETLQI